MTPTSTTDAVIRAATDADIPALVTLGERFLADTPYGALLAWRQGDHGAAMGTFAARLLDSTYGAVFVAERARDGLVGVIALVALPHPVSGLLMAEEVAWWVEPAARRSSTVGPALLAAGEAWACTRGCALLKVSRSGSRRGRFGVRGYAAVETVWIKRLGD